MIRRHDGDRFLLVAQHDHALLSGQLAEHYGNGRFARPEPRGAVIRAVGMHDCGWPMHDQRPTLNKEGWPVDVFETPLPLALKVWQAGTDRMEGEDVYARMLVSLHVLGLSAFAASHAHTRTEIFELNRFQHKQIELQEQLRRKLGMSTEIPLRLGLATEGKDENEERLKRNHTILQAMDRLSLALCCTEVVFPKIENVAPKAGAAAVTLSFARTGETAVKVEPWPFDAEVLSAQVPYRAVAARKYVSQEEFAEAYAKAPVEMMNVTAHS